LAFLNIEKHPFRAGLILGLLSFKPHLIAIVPLFLVVGRAWRTLAGLGISVFALVLASAIVFGIESWIRFFEKIPFMLSLLKGGFLQMHQVVSTVGALLLVGVPYDVAVLVHMVLAVIGICMAAVTWYQNKPSYIRHSLAVLSILFVTPYANSYDLTLLALPICWIGWEAYKKEGISGFDSFFLVAAWFLPVVTVFLAAIARLQIAPFFILGMSVWVYRYNPHNGVPEPSSRNPARKR
jgi:hypothetical protein